MEKKTPLYDAHVRAQGEIVSFGGYLLPVQYSSGVISEHMAVRTQAGLFDVSHMGKILCEGKEALANLEYILTNSFTGMTNGQARYSPMCNEAGGTVDDLIVYKKNDNHYLIVVNAANKDRDFHWMCGHSFGHVTFRDVSEDYALLALQGPKALEILSKLTDSTFALPKYYHGAFDSQLSGIPCIVSRTGYTGEDGVEIYLSSDQGEKMWELLMAAGEDQALTPCGLGARDTLRLEAAMPLYGHEMDETISPIVTGLGFAVKMSKKDFVGKSALERNLHPRRKRIGLKVTGMGSVREHQEVYLGEKKVGTTTSGTHCPYLGYPVAMAIVDTDCTNVGLALDVDVRGHRIPVEVVALPFYRRKKELSNPPEWSIYSIKKI